MYSFTGGTSGSIDGYVPAAALIRSSDGNFYGTTVYGGQYGNQTIGSGNFVGLGTVFKVTPSGVETVLHSFGNGVDGQSPYAGLIQGSDGNFYGTTEYGGLYSDGSVFKITPAGFETVLHAFTPSTVTSPPDGTEPVAALIQGSDGNFYGTTQAGGEGGVGTVFLITPSGAETVLYSFAGGSSDGSEPVAALVLGSDGNFYGTTTLGGLYQGGTVFKITPAGVETVLYSFIGGNSDGAEPVAGLIQGSDGNFYGTTEIGGAANAGTVFKITPSGIETVLFSFSGHGDGQAPEATLIQGNDGNFYGTTSEGGLDSDGTGFGGTGYGTVFKITPAGVETLLYAFNEASSSGLLQTSDGSFYGATGSGGATGGGTVFKLTVSGN